MTFGLDHVIAPHQADDFLSCYWSSRALLIPGDPGKFGDLFGWEDINHALAHGRLRPPDVMLVLEKQKVPPEGPEQIEEWLRKGATLVLNHVQTLDPVVDRFASALARDLNTVVNVNCYASWPAKQGFDLHFDRHDVFVVQVAGEKAWRVFEPTHLWPVEREQGAKIPPADMQPYLTCSLAPGDVLYIPRGHWHDAVAETPSIHLTVGPAPRTGVDFLAWLTGHLMATDPLVRQSFPLARARALGGDRPEQELQEHWDAVRRRLVDVLGQDGLLDAFLQFCMTQNRVRRTYQLPHHVMLGERLTMDTPFVVAPDQKALIRYDPESRLAEVTLRGQILRLERVPERFAEAVFGARDSLRGADLLAAHPDLSAEHVRRCLLRLFDAGVLLLPEESLD